MFTLTELFGPIDFKYYPCYVNEQSCDQMRRQGWSEEMIKYCHDDEYAPPIILFKA